MFVEKLTTGQIMIILKNILQEGYLFKLSDCDNYYTKDFEAKILRDKFIKVTVTTLENYEIILKISDFDIVTKGNDKEKINVSYLQRKYYKEMYKIFGQYYSMALYNYIFS